DWKNKVTRLEIQFPESPIHIAVANLASLTSLSFRYPGQLEPTDPDNFFEFVNILAPLTQLIYLKVQFFEEGRQSFPEFDYIPRERIAQLPSVKILSLALSLHTISGLMNHRYWH